MDFITVFNRATELSSENFYQFSVRAQTRLGWGATARVLVLTTANRAAPAPPPRPNVSRSLLQAHHITFSWTPGDDGYAPLRYIIVLYIYIFNVTLGHKLNLAVASDHNLYDLALRSRQINGKL